MRGRISEWLERRRTLREEREFEHIVEEITGLPNTKLVRSWSEEKLHQEIAAERVSKAERSLLQSELRRREAWAAPAGKAFWISLIALGFSATSIAVTLFG